MTSDAAIILKMIEEVSPNDTAKLDEIDARVWCILSQNIWLGAVKNDREHIVTNVHKISGSDTPWSCNAHAEKYTRSRDALKVIRPEGYWLMRIWTGPNGSECQIVWYENVFNFASNFIGKVVTEELAELSSYLQAIEFTHNSEKTVTP